MIDDPVNVDQALFDVVTGRVDGVGVHGWRVMRRTQIRELLVSEYNRQYRDCGAPDFSAIEEEVLAVRRRKHAGLAFERAREHLARQHIDRELKARQVRREQRRREDFLENELTEPVHFEPMEVPQAIVSEKLPCPPRATSHPDYLEWLQKHHALRTADRICKYGPFNLFAIRHLTSKRPAFYVLGQLDEAGTFRATYVGHTHDLRHRLREHVRVIRNGVAGYTHVEFEPTRTIRAALLAECAVFHHHPHFDNVRHPRLRNDDKRTYASEDPGAPEPFYCPQCLDGAPWFPSERDLIHGIRHRLRFAFPPKRYLEAEFSKAFISWTLYYSLVGRLEIHTRINRSQTLHPLGTPIREASIPVSQRWWDVHGEQDFPPFLCDRHDARMLHHSSVGRGHAILRDHDVVVSVRREKASVPTKVLYGYVTVRCIQASHDEYVESLRRRTE